MNSLRKDLKSLLAGILTSRPAAVRREKTDQALLATDLSLLLEASDRERAAMKLAEAGWTVSEKAGWWLLDRPLLPGDMPPAGKTAEADCCLRLLRLHAGGRPAPPEMVRDLWKAADTDEKHLQELLLAWHRQFAVSLREHDSLPDGLIPYLRIYSREATEQEGENRDGY